MEIARTWDFMESFENLTQECLNDDLGVTLNLFMTRSKLLSVFLYGISS